jgi:DNA processing protein
VLVVEAAVGSGALITAKDAIAQGRDVFAIPGKVSDPGAEGPNELIKNGSLPVLSSSDILKYYEFIWGSDYDLKRLEKAKKRMPLANKALEKYRMAYAADAEADTPEFELKSNKAKKESGRSQVRANEAEETANIPEETKETKENKGVEPSESASQIVEGLDPITRGIYENIPLDRAVSPDALMIGGLSASDVITALTLMEIYGLISSLPGGLYIRK